MDANKYFELVKSRKLLAQKELGQNYLINPIIAEKIIDNLCLEKNDNLLEIGCGLGSLSYFIVQHDCSSTMIDIDDGSLLFVNENLSHNNNHKIINSNIMRMDISSFNKIVGNLPYYITSGIIERVLLYATNVKEIILMCQKETFERLTALQGTKDYGPLPILLKYIGDVIPLFDVSRNNFCPAPHVDSFVFQISVKEHDNISLELYKVCKAMFLHRRKTILNNLKAYLHNDELSTGILSKLNVNPLARPESLDLNFYIELTKQLKPYLQVSRIRGVE